MMLKYAQFSLRQIRVFGTSLLSSKLVLDLNTFKIIMLRCLIAWKQKTRSSKIKVSRYQLEHTRADLGFSRREGQIFIFWIDFLTLPNSYKDPILPNFLQKWPKKAFIGVFGKLRPKNHVFLARSSDSLEKDRRFRKVIGFVSQKWKSLNKTKGDPLGRHEVKILKKSVQTPACFPLNQLVRTQAPFSEYMLKRIAHGCKFSQHWNLSLRFKIKLNLA